MKFLSLPGQQFSSSTQSDTAADCTTHHTPLSSDLFVAALPGTACVLLYSSHAGWPKLSHTLHTPRHGVAHCIVQDSGGCEGAGLESGGGAQFREFRLRRNLRSEGIGRCEGGGGGDEG